MKQNKNEHVHVIFIGDNLQLMSNLLITLGNNNYAVSLKKAGNVPYEAYHIKAKPWYKIVAPVSQHSEVFDTGIDYCIKNNLDDVICCYPNHDFDTIKNIKERESGLNM